MIGFLVDLGKTIVDNKGYDYTSALRKVYDLTDKNVSFDDLYTKEKIIHNYLFPERRINNIEIVFDKYIEMVLKVSGLNYLKTKEELEECFFNEITKYEGIYENADKLLKYLKKHSVSIIAVSNSCFSSRALKEGLKKLDILDYFDDVISSADVLYTKPDKRIFEEAIDKMLLKGVTKENMYFLGNDYNCDIIGANNVNLKPIWINVSKSLDEEKIAFLNVSSYEELIGILEKLI